MRAAVACLIWITCLTRKGDQTQLPLDPVLLRTHGTLGAVPPGIVLLTE